MYPFSISFVYVCVAYIVEDQVPYTPPKFLYTADVEAPADVAKPVDTLFDVEKAFAEMGIPSAVSGMRYMKGGGSY
jgi:hypothetical protein